MSEMQELECSPCISQPVALKSCCRLLRSELDHHMIDEQDAETDLVLQLADLPLLVLLHLFSRNKRRQVASDGGGEIVSER